VHIERELKFRLTTGALPRLARLAPRRRKLTSIYYDTPEQQLRRAGVALRLRRDGKAWLQALKSESAPGGGLAARAEWEMPVQGKALDLGAFPHDEIRMATGVDLASLARRLRPMFETRFTRRSGLLELPGKGSAELAIDRGFIVAARRREPISEVELELKSGEPRGLLQLGEQLALPLAYESKAERGYRLAAGLPRAPRKWRMPALDAAGAPGAAFAALFAAALMQAGSNAPGVLDSSDPEYLHQLRVGLRRLRSAMRAFAPILRGTKPIKRSLRLLMPALGTARDWDVFVQRLDHAKARGRRNAARRAARAAVSSPQFQAFLLRALRWLQAQSWRESPLSLAQFGREALERLHRKTLKSSTDNVKRRHRLRIRVKRLRYACEFFAPCFPPAAVKPYVRELEKLQDILGELNDAAVARTLLQEIETRPPPSLALRERQLGAALAAAWAAFRKQPPYWCDRG